MIHWIELTLPVDPPGTRNIQIPQFDLTLTFKLREIAKATSPYFSPETGNADPGGPAEFEPIAILLEDMELTWPQAHQIFGQETLSYILRAAEDQCQAEAS